ncbi:MAG: hypothetical protein PHN56_03250 [Candidatus Nanoarchaeia archaeon]|nr:hypothetical protein [Candidatus Nanoarchaeia archaeon]
MPKFLITRPEHDDTTFLLSSFMNQTITFAKDKGFEVFDLHREKANKSNYEGLVKNNPEFIVFNGHGTINMVTGHKNQPLLIAGTNDYTLKSKTIYAISCQSGVGLGSSSIKEGALSYTGYINDFILYYSPELISRPLNDSTLKLFLEPSVILVESLLKGNSINESHAKCKEKMVNNFKKMISSNEEDYNDMAQYLWWDIQNFRTFTKTEILD